MRGSFRHALSFLAISLAAGVSALAMAAGTAPFVSGASTTTRTAPVLVSSSRGRVLAAAASLVGKTELTGRNDGAIVDAVLASVGLEKTRSPYCAAFNRWSYDQANLRRVGPRSAWSPDWVAQPTWTRKAGGRTPQPGDTWGIYFESKGRIAHTGMVEKWGDAALTIEGNTAPQAASGEADRNGDGFWRKRRLRSQIYAVRDWIGD